MLRILPLFQIEQRSAVRVACNAFFTVLIGSRRLINESVWDLQNELEVQRVL